MASIEANFELQKLVGKENFYAGINSSEFSSIKNILKIYQSEIVHIPHLREIEQAEGVIILGEDILQTAPRLALAVRQSVKNKPMDIAKKLNIQRWNAAAVKSALGTNKGPLFIATHLQRLLAKWSADRPGQDEGLQSGGKSFPNHAGGLSECGDLSREV